jgi:ribonuclease Z
MDLSVLFLGTAGSMPTVQRAPASLLVRRGGDRILIDCGEGTQRQLLRSVGLPDLEHVFLTHYHADHFLGLPGMLKTFALRGREVPLTIYGPRGLHLLMSDLRRVYGKLTYEVRLQELQPSETVPFDGFGVGAYAVVHRLEALGYALFEDERPGRFDLERARELGVPEGPAFGRLQHGEAVEANGRVVEPREVMGAARPGRRLVFTGDTEPCDATVAVATGAQLLVHDGTFADEELERARQTGHSTAQQAAAVARAANVSLLALTHLSSRYFAPVIEKEARAVFERTVVPRDFDVVEVPYPDSGREPELIRWKEYKQRLLSEPVAEGSEPVPEAP